MVQIKNMTYQEKVDMYNKCTKSELISMLIACEAVLRLKQSRPYFNEEDFYTKLIPKDYEKM